MWGPGGTPGLLVYPGPLPKASVERGERMNRLQSSYLSLETIRAGSLGRGRFEHPTITPNTSVQSSDPTGMALFWTDSLALRAPSAHTYSQ